MALSLANIDRNDPAAALRYAEQLLDEGTYTQAIAQTLCGLQDDADDLDARLGEMIRERREGGRPVEIGRFSEDDEDDEAAALA
jgi:hypothetical protein